MIARRYLIRGTVQGVGFRHFARKAALELNVTGTVKNRDDGSVEVVAVGPSGQLSQLAGRLHTGPRGSQVRGVEEQEAPMQQYDSFTIQY